MLRSNGNSPGSPWSQSRLPKKKENAMVGMICGKGKF